MRCRCDRSSRSASRAACFRAPRLSSSCWRRSRSTGSAFGLVLIVAFSLGLALTITGIGLVAVFAKRVFGRMRMDGMLIRLLPAVSALVILVAGALMTARAIPQLT